MTATRSRSGRSLAALLAAVLISSVLALVGVSAAGAANTASEAGLDDEGNRTLAGEDRYDTAIALADNVLEAGWADVGDLALVSGVSLVDAIPSVTLASSRFGAVMLTPTDRLDRDVEDFIAEWGFDRVTIVGQTAAVSEDVEDRLNELEFPFEVDRIGGADRYETAVEVARAGDGAGEFCDTGEFSVFMVSGESLVDGVVVAPVAYAMNMPVLYTRPDSLPESVSDYLNDFEIERVVIVGDEGQVSSDVADEIEVSGATVQRIAGAVATDRSVALYDAIKDCEAVSLAENTFAVLDRDEPIDGVTAAASLASGIGTGTGLVPVLAVRTDALHASVADTLTSIPVSAGGSYQNVSFYALGGTSRISDAYMNVLRDTATTSSALEAAVTWPVPDEESAGRDTFTVRFTGEVDPATVVDKSAYEVAGGPLATSDTVCWDPATATVTVDMDGFALSPGDEIIIVGNKISGNQDRAEVAARVQGECAGERAAAVATCVATAETAAAAEVPPRAITAAERTACETTHNPGPGTYADNRMVSAAVYTVPSVDDRRRPEYTILAALGADRIRVLLDEENPELPASAAAGRLAGQVEVLCVDANGDAAFCYPGETDAIEAGRTALRLASAESSYVNSQGATVTIPARDGIRVFPSGKTNKVFDIFLNCAATATEADTCADSATKVDLAATHFVTLYAGAFRDALGNESRGSRTLAPFFDDQAPALTGRQSMTTGLRSVDGVQTYSSVTATATVGGVTLGTIELGARPDGAAAGAAGNAWKFSLLAESTTADDDANPEVSIEIGERRRIIAVTYDEDTRVSDIVQAMESHAGLNQNFFVRSTYDNAVNYFTATLPLPTATAPATPTTREVGPWSYSSDPETPDFDGGVLEGGETEAKLTLFFSEELQSFNAQAFADQQPAGSPFNSDVGTLDVEADDGVIPGPVATVTLTYVYTSAGSVPGAQVDIVLPAGVATDFGGNVNVADSETVRAAR